MKNRQRTAWFRSIATAGLATCLLAATTYADQPNQTDSPKAKQPAPRTMKAPPRRSTTGIPEPTVKLKPGQLPAAVFDTPVYDFGSQRAGVAVLHDYKFKNTGNGPLEILRVKPGCGCTTAGDYTKIVKPGGAGVIPIKLKPGHMAGPVHKSITVNTNIPGKESVIVLEIKGTVWAPVQVTPRSAAFGRLTPDGATDGVSRTLTIVNNLDHPMKPGKIESSNDAFTATLKPVEEGKKYELVVHLTKNVVEGNNAAQINIETGLDDPKTVEIPAYAFLSPPVDITPSKLVLPSGRNAELTRRFYIRSNTTKTIEVTDLKCSTDKLKLELKDIRGDKLTYRLSVTIPADYQPPAQGDEITFKTSDPSVPVGRIPVTGTYVGGARPPANSK